MAGPLQHTMVNRMGSQPQLINTSKQCPEGVVLSGGVHSFTQGWLCVEPPRGEISRDSSEKLSGV